ncbi:MAG TPA: hypothetical protein PLU71_05010 [Candidatus Dependentiae bacterium]|nr:hypothetical protein [Candidatus Dependentiae bacterium]HRQ63195.1 hypothetical protein [Candidatus Dependentiae bacterium]
MKEKSNSNAQQPIKNDEYYRPLIELFELLLEWDMRAKEAAKNQE